MATDQPHCSPRLNRFPRSARLRSRHEFVAVFEAGWQSATGRMKVFMAIREESTEHNESGGPQPVGPRLGVSISRRYGNAVQRNRAKRLVREAFRTMRHAWPANTDWVVIPRGNRDLMTLDRVKASLQKLSERLLERANLVANPTDGLTNDSTSASADGPTESAQ
ncbi:MAG: ribonuclease P protein component [Phycisphaerae bacterium]|nr:ribonuclease P protein component [Phycisphaerae bacterium]